MKVHIEFEPAEIKDAMEFLTRAHGGNAFRDGELLFLDRETSRGETETSIVYSPGTPIPVPLPPVGAPTPAVLTGGDLDSRGFPWDERIHAATKTKTQDGVWKRKRGVDEALVKQVEGVEVIPSFFPAAQVPPPPAQDVAPGATYENIEALVSDEIKKDPMAALPKLQPVLARFGCNTVLDFKSKDAATVAAGYTALLGAFRA